MTMLHIRNHAVHSTARGYAYAKIQYVVGVHAYLSKTEYAYDTFHNNNNNRISIPPLVVTSEAVEFTNVNSHGPIRNITSGST